MRVLQVYNILGALTERVWLEVPLALAERGWRPAIWYEQWADECPEIQYTVIERERVNVTDGTPAEVRSELEELADRQGVSGPVPELIHCHTGPRMLQVLGMLKAGVPCVVSLYGYDASRLLRDPAWGVRYAWAAAHGCKFVALGEAMKRAVVGVGVPEAAVEIIRLGIDTGQWTFSPKPLARQAVLLAVGRLVEKKGFDTLIAAMALLPGVKLNLVGDGPLRAKLAVLAESVAPGRVDLLGKLDRAATAAQMNLADCLVVSSRTAADGDAEGTPIVLMEALAVGTPVVSTDNGCCRDVVPDSYVTEAIAAEGDAKGLATAIDRVLAWTADHRASMQVAGRKWVESRYDLKDTVAAYDALYRALVTRRPA